ncbi:unnamed protein product [Phaedon cochleariae]|uniref:IkappaB kinase n=1 Tax=Phaedon cochleariae TaxID=80249 RepID=A0A9N9SHH5_PHACE|nr:unnamed protein product [Phaedon cochleariae]
MVGLIQIGTWQKISDLGSGAFGIVSLWKNNENDDCVAIKRCKFQTNINLSQKQKERWLNEVDIMKIINHPNIIKYKPLPPELESALLKQNPTNLPLMPMEYCRRGNLRHFLCKPKNISGLQEQDVRYILEDISSGLQYLHSLKITHRDIKPDNIVLQHCDNRCGNTIYKIIDLGYAKELHDSIVSFVGTLHYLAPEIFETEQYNYSVDYWSMGILTFEIICGVLPYLPHIPPFERFGKIRDKGADDICIYLNYSGQITNSSEIKKEHFISSTLKSHIEIWLRHVLQFDQNRRCKNFPGNVKVFDYLRNVLKKSIVRVFSVRKLEFYSYEVNEGTLVSTLKEWISRDIKIPKNDLILLFENGTSCMENKSVLLDILGEETDIYVISKNYLTAEIISYTFPKLIKEAMKSALKFNFSYLRQLRAQMIYYISTEKTIANYFRTSFFLYLRYLNSLVKGLNKKIMLTSKSLSKLLMKVECYSKIRENNGCDIYFNLSNKTEYNDCLNYLLRLTTSLERSISDFDGLTKNIEVIFKRQKILKQLLPGVTKILNKYNLEEQLSRAVILLEKTAVPTKNFQINPKDMISSITTLVSETIRVKDTLFKDKHFKAYLSAMKIVLNGADNILGWMEQYDSHIQELETAFDHVEIIHHNILIKAAGKDDTDKHPSDDSFDKDLFCDLPSSYLIKENHELRYKFEDVLSASILEHKMFIESMKPYSVP